MADVFSKTVVSCHIVINVCLLYFRKVKCISDWWPIQPIWYKGFNVFYDWLRLCTTTYNIVLESSSGLILRINMILWGPNKFRSRHISKMSILTQKLTFKSLGAQPTNHDDTPSELTSWGFSTVVQKPDHLKFDQQWVNFLGHYDLGCYQSHLCNCQRKEQPSFSPVLP